MITEVKLSKDAVEARVRRSYSIPDASPAPRLSLKKRAAAEGVSTAFLLAAVVGSGIMGERLAGGNVAVALLANTLATGAALIALIAAFGPISGSHMNPIVTLADAYLGGLPWAEVPIYVLAQLLGACCGVALAHLMFGMMVISLSTHIRSGPSQFLSEVVATFGLIATICGCSRTHPSRVPYAVGAYITAAYWFTASTSFANPAVTLARTLTNTFTGIRMVDSSAFIAAQCIGCVAAVALFRWFHPASKCEELEA